MTNIKHIVEDNNSRAGFWFDVFIQLLIVISLVLYSIETMPNLSPGTKTFLWYSRAIIVAVFTVEYILRIVVADNKVGFVTSFYGIVDLLAILPFYLSPSVDLRGLRAFRLLRLFQALKLVRYSRAMQRFHRALILSKEELILFLFVSLLMVYFSACGIHFFENQAQPDKFSSVFDSLWWAVVTLTTVGYGDVFPITIGGRVFTFFMLFVALGIVSIPAGIIASALQQARMLENNNQLTNPKQIPDPSR